MKRIIAIVLCLAMAVSFTACADKKDEGEVTTAPETQIDLSVYEVEYPVTVTDALDREVTLDKAPEKIVSTYYAATNLIAAYGKASLLVAVEEGADSVAIYKKAVESITKLPAVTADGVVDAEAIKGHSPDLAVISADQMDVIEALEAEGIKVLAFDSSETNGMINMMINVGKAINAQYKSKLMQESYFNSIAKIGGGRLEEEETPKVYFAGGASVLNAKGSESIENKFAEAVCVSNVAAELTADASYEQIIQWNPDYIVIASDAEYTAEDVLNDERLAECNAVKNGNVLKMPAETEAWDSELSSNYLAQLWLAAKLHPTKYTIVECNKAMKAYYEEFYGFQPENMN